MSLAEKQKSLHFSFHHLSNGSPFMGSWYPELTQVLNSRPDFRNLQAWDSWLPSLSLLIHREDPHQQETFQGFSKMRSYLLGFAYPAPILPYFLSRHSLDLYSSPLISKTTSSICPTPCLEPAHKVQFRSHLLRSPFSALSAHQPPEPL